MGIKIFHTADLHLGMRFAGYPEIQNELINARYETLENMVKTANRESCALLFMAGDLFDRTTLNVKDISRAARALNEFEGELVIVLPGNHDGNIRKIAPENVIIHPSNGIVFDDIGFVHGHRWPDSEIMQCKQIIIGHTHPTIMLTDRLGYKKFEPCWLKVNLIEGKLKEKYPNSADPQVLVLPAFNPLCGGIAANKEGVTGPIGKIMDIENAQVYLLDGSCLGKVKNIK